MLDWNQPAIDFYLSIGAQPQGEWVRYRMEGEALTHFAAHGGAAGIIAVGEAASPTVVM